MTTIAYRDGVLAADTLCCFGNSRDGFATKAVKRGPYLAAASGAVAAMGRFLDWVRGGLQGEPPPMPDGDHTTFGIIVCPDGSCLTFGPSGWERTKADTYAIGSGADYAQGALAMGASAEEAVRIAMQFDVKTGGEITVIRH